MFFLLILLIFYFIRRQCLSVGHPAEDHHGNNSGKNMFPTSRDHVTLDAIQLRGRSCSVASGRRATGPISTVTVRVEQRVQCEVAAGQQQWNENDPNTDNLFFLMLFLVPRSFFNWLEKATFDLQQDQTTCTTAPSLHPQRRAADPVAIVYWPRRPNRITLWARFGPRARV